MHTVVRSGFKTPMRTAVPIFAVFTSALILGSVVLPNESWAKHKAKDQKSVNADPCAEPTAFVKNQIGKIRAAQAAQSAHANSSVFGLFSSTQADPGSYAKIADLRRDADGVNNLLRVGGCTPVDIDNELKMPAPAAVASPTQSHKKHH
jgi:hypothetical protein